MENNADFLIMCDINGVNPISLLHDMMYDVICLISYPLQQLLVLCDVL